MRRLLATVLVLAAAGRAGAFAVFTGDPVDGQGRAFEMLPGLPLILPQPGRPDDFDPPIIDTSLRGDVDLVVRAGLIGLGPVMPPPVASPPVAIAGGTRVVAGSDIPFTVFVSDGSGSGSGNVGRPLGGTELDGIPVIVAAYADYDGDGIIGPTNADPAGATDNDREFQEAGWVVGRQVAIFSGGIAQGRIALTKGVPASSGGLTVVLTAFAYVGPYVASFMEGNLPFGPGIATLMPAFPRLDPDKVLDGNGGGGPGRPDGRLGVLIEPAFDPPVGHPALGTPFALPTDGTSPTIDRAIVRSGPFTRCAFVVPSSLAGFPHPAAEIEVPLMRGVGGVIYEPLRALAIPDDGPGGGLSVRLVPVDELDNVTDPPAGTTVTLQAGAGLRIAAPDADGNPQSETVVVGAAGVDVLLDDAGGRNDSGVGTTLTVASGGYPTEALAVAFGGGVPGTTSTTTTTTTIPGGVGAAPVIRGVAVGGAPTAFVLGCRARRTLAAVVADPDGDPVEVDAAFAVNGALAYRMALGPGEAPARAVLPSGPVFSRGFVVRAPTTGTLGITISARDLRGNVATPMALTYPLVATSAPAVTSLTLSPGVIVAGDNRLVTFSVEIEADCPVVWVAVEIDAGDGFRRVGRLRDHGRRGDPVAGDGMFAGTVRIPTAAPGAIPVRVLVRDRLRVTATSPASVLQVVAP